MYTVFYFALVEELKRFMEVAKLQDPTRRNKEREEPKPKAVNQDTVKQEDDGTVTISKMEILPFSSGRERFGAGTKAWGKFPIESPGLQRFSR